MWIFVYKTNKHSLLQKCKARLVVCENQQTCEDLLTKVIILASMMFYVLIILIAKFDLEIVQMNTVNAFVNCRLDEVIYMRQLSDFKIGNTILQLRKTLYELR